jgi:phosphoglucosamine mutase
MITQADLKYFGTDGIRGTLDGPYMNPEFIERFAIALARYLRMRHDNNEIHLVIGRDTRLSGQRFEEIIIEHVLPYGINIDLMGVLPTPAVSFWVDELEADNGLVITASHNPANYNGLKLFNAHGVKQTVDKEAVIEQLIDETPPPRPKYKKGELLFHPEAISIYVDSVCELLPKGSIKDWKIVLDTANGATIESSRQAFEQLGASVIPVGNSPDGRNINENVGSEFPEALARTVLEHSADLGIAHDGDGDRLVIVDDKGQVLQGEQLMALVALEAKAKKELTSDAIVTTIQSNSALDQFLAKHSIKVHRTDVGDRFVYEKMRKANISVGGEPSGHYIFSDYAQSGDGLLSAFKLIEVMLHQDKKLSQLREIFELFPQKLVSLNVKEKLPLNSLEHTQAAVALVENKIGDKGRVLLRYSGTESKIRLLVEDQNASALDDHIAAINASLRKDLTVL